jgi:hypothetical protein
MLIFWVLVSLFAVIGLLECVVSLVEFIGMRNVKSISSAVWQVTLQGEISQVEFLLNTLSVKSTRMDLGEAETILELIDGGLTAHSRAEIAEYCEKNPWVRFTVPQDNDII